MCTWTYTCFHARRYWAYWLRWTVQKFIQLLYNYHWLILMATSQPVSSQLVCHGGGDSMYKRTHPGLFVIKLYPSDWWHIIIAHNHWCYVLPSTACFSFNFHQEMFSEVPKLGCQARRCLYHVSGKRYPWACSELWEELRIKVTGGCIFFIKQCFHEQVHCTFRVCLCPWPTTCSSISMLRLHSRTGGWQNMDGLHVWKCWGFAFSLRLSFSLLLP